MRTQAFNRLMRPEITIRQIDADGKEISRQRANNNFTYAMMDVLMNAWLRSSASQVTHLYLRFGDEEANPGYLAPPGFDIRATTRDTFLESTDAIRGGLWVPVLSAPVQEPTDPAKYIGNRGTFFFRVPANIASAQVTPSDNFDIATSFIYAMGLAVAFNTTDRNFDRIVSVMQAYGYDDDNSSLGNFTKFQIPTGGQTAIDYTVPFAFETQISNAPNFVGFDWGSMPNGAADYGGVAPTWVPISGFAVTIDTVTERIWWYYSGSWH